MLLLYRLTKISDTVYTPSHIILKLDRSLSAERQKKRGLHALFLKKKCKFKLQYILTYSIQTDSTLPIKK